MFDATKLPTRFNNSILNFLLISFVKYLSITTFNLFNLPHVFMLFCDYLIAA